MEKKTLKGLRILLTREKKDNELLKSLLVEKGASVIEIPAIKTAGLNPENDKEILKIWDELNWLIVTSKKGVSFFVKWMSEKELQMPAAVKIAAVGKGTAGKAGGLLREVSFIPEIEDGEHLASGLLKNYPPSSALFPVAKGGVRTAQSALRKGGWNISELELYETRSRSISENEVSELEKGLDIAFFASPSAVRAFGENKRALNSLSTAFFLPIGNTTLNALEEAGMTALQPPRRTDAESVLKAVENFYNKMRHNDTIDEQ